MALKRTFLGWDGPVAARVCDVLLTDGSVGPVDLQGLLTVVPTRQAGRRLREALARRCAEHDTALLSARVVTPSFFGRPVSDPTATACGAVVKATWAHTVLAAEPEVRAGLLDDDPETHDFGWAAGVGEMVQRLRRALVEGGHTVADVPRLCGPGMDECERWNSLARLEQDYLARLAKQGLKDPCARALAVVMEPELPEDTRRIVVAAVPDPSLFMVRALEVLAAHMDVEILVCAPQETSDLFDDWGRPDPAGWRNAPIPVPDPDEQIVLEATPAAQARRTAAEIARVADRFGPADVAVGVPDPGVMSCLQSELQEQGLAIFDPSERASRSHTLYRLVEAYCSLAGDDSFHSLARFLRHPDVLDCLVRSHGVSAGDLLRQLDDHRARHLPDSLAAVCSELPDSEPDTRDRSDLAAAVGWTAARMATARGAEPVTALRALLCEVYAGRELSDSTIDREQRACAEVVDGCLREFECPEFRQAAGSEPGVLRLLVSRIAEESYSPEVSDSDIEAEGWLELPWNDAACLIVTGMNEGSVPDSRPGDVFLPDTLRSRLGLRDDARRLARDAFLLRGMLESRRDRGHVCLIAGKTSAAGEPLKPSRLLFRCEDAELPFRAQRLFRPVSERRGNHPATISFLLDPAGVEDQAPRVEHMRVTSFREYLACPFRFYLKNVLGMQSPDTDKRGLDAMDFGNMVHAVLYEMAGQPQLRNCDDETRIADFLETGAQQWVSSRFGPDPALPVLVALDAARQRLRAAARVQTGLVREGWEIQQAEQRCELELNGVRIVGTIDRVDRHRETGRLRILDYKTSDKNEEPAAVHLVRSPAAGDIYAEVSGSSPPKRWTDLQLPLYRMLWSETTRCRQPPEVGYFNLPKAVSHTAVYAWPELDDTLYESACVCAREIARRVSERCFWPPDESIKYDDFEDLFPGPPADCVDGKAFLAFLAREGGGRRP